MSQISTNCRNDLRQPGNCVVVASKRAVGTRVLEVENGYSTGQPIPFAGFKNKRSVSRYLGLY